MHASTCYASIVSVATLTLGSTVWAAQAAPMTVPGAPPAGVTTATASANQTTSPPAGDEDPPPLAVYGLFPLWEHTGAVEESGAVRVGMRHAQVGVGFLTVGTDPYLDLFGTLNASAKVGVVRHGPVRLALQAGYYRVPTAAETKGIGNLHATGFTNPYAPVALVPVSAAATFLAARRLHLHASATVLRTLSSEAESRTLTAGVATWAEWWATSSRSVRLHVGAEGWPEGTQEHVGLSFAWRSRHAALQAGYARRFAPEGTSANAIMFDGAVLFP